MQGIPHSTKLVVLIALFIFAPTLSRASSAPKDSNHIRVALIRQYKGIKQITVLASSDYAILNGTGDKIASSTNLAPIILQADTAGITLKRDNGDSAGVGTFVIVSPIDPSAVINVDSPGLSSKQYHGTLEVSFKSGCLGIVNIVDLEDYLPGVLASEMPSSYPGEALKAQAIAARTYTLDNMSRHADLGCDVCDDSHCQVYDGTLREKQNCIKAVLDTKGLVLKYKGELASPMYCADCGGSTQDYSEIYSSRSIPYLCGVTEPEDVAHSSWQQPYTIQELSDKLVKAGIKEAAGLQKVEVDKASSSGRVVSATITGANGTASITGNRVRSILGRTTIKSTLFTVEPAPDGGITIKGKGFGHGIGLCQVGAKGLAGPPHNFNFQQILEHYYPGTTVAPIDASFHTASSTPKMTPKVVAKKPTANPAPHEGAGPPRKANTGAANFEIRLKTPSL